MAYLPTKPAPISGYRSRAINAVADFADALRPVAGPGINITSGAGGKTISAAPALLGETSKAWTVRVVPTTGPSPSTVTWAVRVWGGLALLKGVELAAPSTPAGTDSLTGLSWYDAPTLVTGSNWLCVEHDGSGNWSLAWKTDPIGTDTDAEWRAIAYLHDDATTPPGVLQLEAGVIDLDHYAYSGYDPSGETVAVTLGGDDYNASTDTWTAGDVDEDTGLPTYPIFNPTRLFWRQADHTVYQFRRTLTYNSRGALVEVSAEARTVLFTTVAENL